MAHTPGPWHIKGELTRRAIKNAAGKTVVVIERWTTEEDARLISAAPDMLAALDEALDYFEEREDINYDGTGSNVAMSLATEIRAAIRKATS